MRLISRKTKRLWKFVLSFCPFPRRWWIAFKFLPPRATQTRLRRRRLGYWLCPFFGGSTNTATAIRLYQLSLSLLPQMREQKGWCSLFFLSANVYTYIYTAPRPMIYDFQRTFVYIQNVYATIESIL